MKGSFDPPLPEGVSAARAKALELIYPVTEGRRRVRLEANAGDGSNAIREPLDRHFGQDGRLSRLRVGYAESQVTLTVRGREQRHVVRLWPDRGNLDQSRTAESLRRCLASRHLTYAPRL